ncbi:MAG: MoxR family ATPase [Anaerolineae bacterium]|nr:MoxR family ATPase [Anaerolineae bacterium]
MNTVATVTQKQLMDFLLNVAVVRPVFIWGAPGIGKSAIVQTFAEQVGLDCVSLLGSQLAPEDLIGVPQIMDGVSRFCPPRNIAREESYCLFLDELNACSHEVQKAFYSLIHERRIGEYYLPPGSIVVGAGNRAQDNAIVRPMSSALLNRMVHVHLRVSHRDWLEWAYENEIHQMIIDYIQNRPDHLWAQPPKHEEPFSSPRSWHMLSDALYEYRDMLNENIVEVLAYGCLTPAHATQFKAFFRQVHGDHNLNAILSGDQGWPERPEDRDILYFLSQSFRAHLIKELPPMHKKVSRSQGELVFRAKALLKQLTRINLELAQMVVADQDDGETLPNWFVVEVIRDLPRLARKENGNGKRA